MRKETYDLMLIDEANSALDARGKSSLQSCNRLAVLVVIDNFVRSAIFRAKRVISGTR
jgi:hypothetical protein